MQHIRKPAAGLLLAAMLLLSGCAPDEVKQEAKARKEAYQQAFTDKVKAAYGEDAALRKVECPVESRTATVTPEVTYYASDSLTGQILLDKKRYDAKYFPASDVLLDTVHTDDICNTVIASLPIAPEQIVRTIVTDTAFLEPMFPSDADTLDKALVPGNDVGLIFHIITKEDLSACRDTDFNSIPVLQQLSQDADYSRIQIISVKDTNRIDSLTGKLSELQFYPDQHPYVTDNTWPSRHNRGTKDAYDLYHIRNVIRLSQPQKHLPYSVEFCE